jgi:hypothetical protein
VDSQTAVSRPWQWIGGEARGARVGDRITAVPEPRGWDGSKSAATNAFGMPLLIMLMRIFAGQQVEDHKLINGLVWGKFNNKSRTRDGCRTATTFQACTVTVAVLFIKIKGLRRHVR